MQFIWEKENAMEIESPREKNRCLRPADMTAPASIWEDLFISLV